MFFLEVFWKFSFSSALRVGSLAWGRKNDRGGKGKRKKIKNVCTIRTKRCGKVAKNQW